MATHKVPHGYGTRQPVVRFIEVSKGERPAIEEEVAIWLPVLQQLQLQQEWYVILAGTILGRCATTNNLVPCNRGVATTVRYTASDVAYSYDIENTSTLVTAAKAVANGMAANRPVGWAPFHYLSSSMGVKYVNYELQPHVTTLNDYVVQVPLIWSHQTEGTRTLVNGCLVVANQSNATWAANGAPVRYLAADSAEQIAGRCLIVETIAAYDNLDKVRTVRGLGLSGDGTSGIESWLVATHEDGAAATISAKIAIDLL